MFDRWLKENRVGDFDFSGEILPQASHREFWDTGYKEKYIKKAERFLGFEWPLMRATDFMAFDREGNRTRQETPHFTRRAALFALTIGELLEYKGRFLDDMIDGIFLICEETYWGLSAHRHPMEKAENIPPADDPYIDLFAAETGAALALIHYLFYDKLKEYCPEILTRIEYELDRRIKKPYLKRLDFIWMCNTKDWLVDNWNPWIISNIITVFLLCEKNRIALEDGIKKMLHEINGIYVTYPEDGGCDEGASYWGVSAGAMCDFCEQLYLATNGRINFFTDERLQNAGRYEYRAYIGNGYFVNFADGTAKPTLPISSVLYTFGKRIADQSLCCLAKEVDSFDADTDIIFFDHDTKLRRLIFDVIYEDDIKNEPDLKPGKVCILKDTQNSFVRESDWFYAAKGGNNFERHNHHDVGSFIAYCKNNPVLVDAGSGTYVKDTFRENRYSIWTMRSAWHNLPVINGCEQIGEFSEGGGAHNRADSFSLDGNATHISFAEAYPEAAEVKSVQRQISLKENGIELTDSFEFSGEQNTVCEHFITPLEVKLVDNGVKIGEEFILFTDSEGIFSLDNVSFEGDTKLINVWESEGMNRIKFDFACEKNKTLTLFLRRTEK